MSSSSAGLSSASTPSTSSCAEKISADAQQLGTCVRNVQLSVGLKLKVWWLHRLHDDHHPVRWVELHRRPVLVGLLAFCVLLFYFADVRYGDRPMLGWVIVGLLSGVSGALFGVCTAVCSQVLDPKRYRVPVSRHGLGSYDPKCCRECTRDAALALVALTLSIISAALLGAAVLGLVGLLLSLLYHLEAEHGWSTLANATEEEFSVILALTALLVSLYAAVRHHYKSRVGWWKQADNLIDGNPITDVDALL